MRQGTKRSELLDLLERSPLNPPDDRLTNLYLYQPATILAKLLYVDELYRAVRDIPGDIFELGVWWGANISLLCNLRTVHEPYNRARKVVGFDTFTGYPTPSVEDPATAHLAEGTYAVGEDYLDHLTRVLAAHEQEGPSPGTRKFELVRGRIEETLPRYLSDHRASFVALAYVDLQTYDGTRAALEAIKPRLLPGSVLAMDELTYDDYAGEAQAFREVFGQRGYTIRQSRYLPDRAIVTFTDPGR